MFDLMFSRGFSITCGDVLLYAKNKIASPTDKANKTMGITTEKLELDKKNNKKVITEAANKIEADMGDIILNLHKLFLFA